MFGSLDYIYVPAADVDGEVLRYVQTLGAELVWKVRGMGTTVACLRVGESGPAILLSGHLRGQGAILVYRVQDYATTVAHCARGTSPCTSWRSRTARARRSRWRRGRGTRSTSLCGPTRCTFRRPYRPVNANTLPGCRSRSYQNPDRRLIAGLLEPGLAAACAVRDTSLAKL